MARAETISHSSIVQLMPLDLRRQTKETGQMKPLTWPDIAQYEAALHALARELDRATEREREKIAARLHDDFGQDLVLTKFKLTELADAVPEQYKSSVETVIVSVDALIDNTRTLLDELYAQRVCETGLKAAVQSVVAELRSKHGLFGVVQLGALPKSLKPEVEERLFRAVRELLRNVVKHANATEVSIQSVRSVDRIKIKVSDNGRGFDRDQTLLSELSLGRFGLFSVRASLRSIGATLRIFSRPGEGTRAIITVPFTPGQSQRENAHLHSR